MKRITFIKKAIWAAFGIPVAVKATQSIVKSFGSGKSRTAKEVLAGQEAFPMSDDYVYCPGAHGNYIENDNFGVKHEDDLDKLYLSPGGITPLPYGDSPSMQMAKAARQAAKTSSISLGELDP